MKRDEYPRHYIGPLRGRLSKNPVLFPHFLAFVLPRWPLGVKFQEQQHAGGATGGPAPAARARRCTSPGGRRGLLWVASAPRAGGGPAPTRPSPGTAGSGSRGRARQRAQLAAIALAKGKKKTKPHTHTKKSNKRQRAQGGSWQLPSELTAPGKLRPSWGAERSQRRTRVQRREPSVTPTSVTAGQLRTDPPGAAQFARVPGLLRACGRLSRPSAGWPCPLLRGNEEGPGRLAALL